MKNIRNFFLLLQKHSPAINYIINLKHSAKEEKI